MIKQNMNEIIKTAVGVTIIYIIAVILSLILCDRMSDLESNEDKALRNGSIVLNLR